MRVLPRARLDDWFGKLADYVLMVAEAGAARVADGGVEGAENKLAALHVDGAAKEAVDDLHDRDLDGFLVFEQGDVADARIAEHAVVEVAISLSAKSGRAAADSGDLDVSASANV